MIVLPLYNHFVLPNATVYVSNDEISELNLAKLKEGERVILISARKEMKEEELSQDSFYPIGVNGTVGKSTFEGYSVIKTTSRIRIESLDVMPGGDIQLTVSRKEELDDIDEEDYNNRLSKLKAALINFSRQFQNSQWFTMMLSGLKSFEEIAAASNMWIATQSDEKYRVLEEDSRAARTKMLEDILYEALEIARLNTEASQEQSEDTKKIYRESAIKKQMEYLQKQLDEMNPESVSDVRKFEQKIAESGMNAAARKEAEKVLNRMKQEGQNSNEYGMLYDYLDFMTGLQWKTPKSKKIDLDKASAILDEDHFGMSKIKDRIIQQIAVMNLKKKQSGSILLFVGAPGTGKTSIGQSIAKSLNRKYVRVSLGGVRDEADIRGHRRTYIGAMPGRIMDGISKSGVSNPVIVLDEVDKLSMSYNGDPASALLEVLDPEQNHTFTDHYMNVPYDLSNVMFICTANSIESIPGPLLDRMEVIRFQGYTASDKFQIARKHLLPKAMEVMGVSEESLEVTDEALREVISGYTMESGVRGLKKRLDTLCRIAAVDIVRGGGEKLVVTEENLRKYLDAKPIRHGKVIKDTRPGIVTGLAWTAAGGDILYMETLLTPGTGKVIITGQLESVMKESVSVALTLVQSMIPEASEKMKDHDLHVHVPEGAVKKDGPSAGITLTTALASLFTGKTVDPAIAMTGEISLRGQVMPIGGLPEKLMAAQRAGVKTVLIPVENEEDLEDVAAEVKDKLDIRPVKTAEEVLKITLGE